MPILSLLATVDIGINVGWRNHKNNQSINQSLFKIRQPEPIGN